MLGSTESVPRVLFRDSLPFLLLILSHPSLLSSSLPPFSLPLSLLSLSLSLPISTQSPLCVDYSTCLLNIQQNENSVQTILFTARAIAARSMAGT